MSHPHKYWHAAHILCDVIEWLYVDEDEVPQVLWGSFGVHRYPWKLALIVCHQRNLLFLYYILIWFSWYDKSHIIHFIVLYLWLALELPTWDFKKVCVITIHPCKKLKTRFGNVKGNSYLVQKVFMMWNIRFCVLRYLPKRNQILVYWK